MLRHFCLNVKIQRVRCMRVAAEWWARYVWICIMAGMCIAVFVIPRIMDYATTTRSNKPMSVALAPAPSPPWDPARGTMGGAGRQNLHNDDGFARFAGASRSGLPDGFKREPPVASRTADGPADDHNDNNNNNNNKNLSELDEYCGPKILQDANVNCFVVPASSGDKQCCCSIPAKPGARNDGNGKVQQGGRGGAPPSLHQNDESVGEEGHGIGPGNVNPFRGIRGPSDSGVVGQHGRSLADSFVGNPGFEFAAAPDNDFRSQDLMICLPSVMVIGAQKSGTTVLFSYLLTHPEFQAARYKELHFFDRPNDFDKPTGVISYLRKFPTLDRHMATSSVVGETTPSYILGSHTPDRIKLTLPKSKFILSLRNPIDRAWSEYNMERRRIDMQDDFLKALQMRLPDIAECIRKRVPKLPKYNPAKSNSCDKCECNGCKHHGTCRDIVKFKANEEACKTNHGEWCSCEVPTPEKCFPAAAAIATSCNSCSAIKENLKASASITAFLADCLADATKPDVSVMLLDMFNARKAADKLMGGIAGPGLNAMNEFREPLPIDQCIPPDMFLETIEPVGPAFRKQMEHIRDACFGKGPAGELVLATGTDECWPREVGSAIMFDHIYRSLYFHQVQNWLEVFPRDQLLVFTNEEFRQNPQAVLSRIHSFLGIQDIEYNLSPDDLANVLDTHYPKFEESSGWSMKGDYGEIPADLRAEMVEFFREPVKELENVCMLYWLFWCSQPKGNSCRCAACTRTLAKL